MARLPVAHGAPPSNKSRNYGNYKTITADSSSQISASEGGRRVTVEHAKSNKSQEVVNVWYILVGDGK